MILLIILILAIISGYVSDRTKNATYAIIGNSVAFISTIIAGIIANDTFLLLLSLVWGGSLYLWIFKVRPLYKRNK